MKERHSSGLMWSATSSQRPLIKSTWYPLRFGDWLIIEEPENGRRRRIGVHMAHERHIAPLVDLLAGAAGAERKRDFRRIWVNGRDRENMMSIGETTNLAAMIGNHCLVCRPELWFLAETFFGFVLLSARSLADSSGARMELSCTQTYIAHSGCRRPRWPSQVESDARLGR